MTRRSAVAALATFASAYAGDDAAPFAGTWQLDPSRSSAAALPAKPAIALRLTESGKQIQCEETSAENTAETWAFTLDGQETKSAAGARSRKVIAKWEGSAMLINLMIAGETGSRVVMDRWKVSRDGKRLLIHRQIERPRGEIEADLVYVRK